LGLISDFIYAKIGPMKKRTTHPILPQPVKVDSRICFAISYYATEADANLVAADVQRRGQTYNGGFFHGMPCGRDPFRDYDDPVLGRLYAVTGA